MRERQREAMKRRSVGGGRHLIEDWRGEGGRGGASMDAAGHKRWPMHWRRFRADVLADVEMMTPSSEVT